MPRFMKIGLPVLEKKNFEGFLPYMGVVAISKSGHVTRIMLRYFHFLVPESFHTKFNSEWPSSF